jgi:hypothetical protein
MKAHSFLSSLILFNIENGWLTRKSSGRGIAVFLILAKVSARAADLDR